MKQHNFFIILSNMFAADAKAVLFHFTDDNQADISRAP